MLRMRDIMTRRVVTLEPQMTLREAMEILVARHLSGAPVVSGDRVVGVISAGDLLSFAAAPSSDDERQAEPTIVDDWDEPAEWEDDEASESASYFTDMWDELTRDRYEEELVVDDYFELEESWNMRGGHHFSIADFQGQTVIAVDGKHDDFLINKVFSLIYPS